MITRGKRVAVTCPHCERPFEFTEAIVDAVIQRTQEDEMKPGLGSMMIGRWLRLRKKFLRLREWALVGALAGRRISLRQLWRYARAPKVPRAVWVARLRRCRGCLLYDASLRRCHRDNPYGGAPLGCGCWVPAVATMPVPYEKVHVLHENQVLKNTPLDKTYTETHRGCWGYATMRGEIGWNANTSYKP